MKNAKTPGLEETLKRLGSEEKACVLRRFFKTGKGDYGEGDVFLGVVVPAARKVAKAYRELPLDELLTFLKSPYHEVRLCALLIMVEQYRRGDARNRRTIFQAYRKHTRHINNWDLVDLSAPGIVGEHALRIAPGCLDGFANRASLWDKRIAIVATLTLIRNGQFAETLRLAEKFLSHPHDLMHKAAGWMLREVGKRDRPTLTAFLTRHRLDMPRTMLRYAIEHYPEQERKAWLSTSIG